MGTSVHSLRFGLCGLLVGCIGCLIAPIPNQSPAGERVTAEDTDSIKLGVTTKTEIVERLGVPQFELPDLRLIAYEWDQVDYQVLYVLVGWGLAGGLEDPKVPHILFMAFDRKERVAAFSLEKAKIWRGTPIQQAAREWAKGQGLTVQALPTRFVVLDVPSGQAALYVYHVAGSPAPSPQVWVDGKLEAELKTATYIAMALPSGNHTVTVVAIPESLPPDPGTTVSLDMAPGGKYFISLKNPWVSWNGDLAELKFHAEQEAMPVLSQMAPAR